MIFKAKKKKKRLFVNNHTHKLLNHAARLKSLPVSKALLCKSASQWLQMPTCENNKKTAKYAHS